jgi:hypothetical protein
MSATTAVTKPEIDRFKAAPFEIKLKIWRFCGPRDWSVLASVNREFNTFSKTESLWRAALAQALPTLSGQLVVSDSATYASNYKTLALSAIQISEQWAALTKIDDSIVPAPPLTPAESKVNLEQFFGIWKVLLFDMVVKTCRLPQPPNPKASDAIAHAQAIIRTSLTQHPHLTPLHRLFGCISQLDFSKFDPATNQKISTGLHVEQEIAPVALTDLKLFPEIGVLLSAVTVEAALHLQEKQKWKEMQLKGDRICKTVTKYAVVVFGAWVAYTCFKK